MHSEFESICEKVGFDGGICRDIRQRVEIALVVSHCQ